VRAEAKGGKPRNVPIPRRALTAVDAYLDERAASDGPVTDRSRLFVRRDGSPLTQQLIDRTLRRIASTAAVTDLRQDFPDMTGLSPRNRRYMRSPVAAWPGHENVPRVVAHLPWGHNRELIDKLDDPALREWYARSAIDHGWSRSVRANQIMSRLHGRAGRAASNFAEVLPAGDSELMQQLTKDPTTLSSSPSPPRSPNETSSGPCWRRSNGSTWSSAMALRSSAASGASSSKTTTSSSTC